MDTKQPKVEKHHHHILPVSAALGVGVALLVMTVITVAVSRIDLGPLNFFVAMVVATIKALLVALFFMNLLYDRRENGVIFGTSFLFLIIFIVLTGTDLFFRGDVAVKGPLAAPVAGKSKLVKPWISTPELVAKGKELFVAQCVSCHGAEGKGNGPAAAALNPPPRNFTSDQAWKNGRKATMVFKTLKEGLPGSAMASYATLPVDDRWALTQYVLSLGPTPAAADTPEDFKKAGVDMTGGGQEQEAATIPVAAAMKLLAQPETPVSGSLVHPTPAEEAAKSPGAQIYVARCLSCHGAEGKGGIEVKNLGVNPKAFLTTQPLKGSLPSMQSFESFRKLVVEGIPGEKLMPGAGDLSSAEIQELYQHVKTLVSGR